MIKVVQLDKFKFKKWVKESEKLSWLSFLSFDEDITFGEVPKVEGMETFKVVHKFSSSSFYIEKDGIKVYAVVDRKKVLMSIYSSEDIDIDEKNIVFLSSEQRFSEDKYYEEFFGVYNRYPQKKVKVEEISSTLKSILKFKKGYFFSESKYPCHEYDMVEKSAKTKNINRSILDNIVLSIMLRYNKLNVYYIIDNVIVNLDGDGAIFSSL